MKALNYVIEIFKSQYSDQVLDIANVQFGKGYISVSEWDEQDRPMLVAVLGDHVLGFCSADIVSNEDLPHAELTSILVDDQVGWIKSLAVNPDNMYQGIGTALLEASIALLEMKGIHQLFTEAWRDEGGIRIERMILKNGFIRLAEKENYWYKDSIQRDYKCVACGQPCCCSAVIYYRI